MMTTQDLILSLALRGVVMTPTGDTGLRVKAPAGVLTPEDKAAIATHKQAIIENRARLADVKERVTRGVHAADQSAPGRYNWKCDTVECELAGAALDEAIYRYVCGDAPVDEVAAAFRAWLQTLKQSAPATLVQEEMTF